MKQKIIHLTAIVILLASTTSNASKPPLEYAIGQMMMVGFQGTYINRHSEIAKEIKQYHLGGVILFDHVNLNGKSMLRNIVNPKQLKYLTAKLQRYSEKYNGLPLLIAANQEGGNINTLRPEKGFQLALNYSEQTLGKKNNLNLIYAQALYTGRLLKENGINLNLAPVADLDINPVNPAIGKLERSFGANPDSVSYDLERSVAAYQRADVFCTLKHFPGLGSADQNTDFDRVDVSNTWRNSELAPYRNLIRDNKVCEFIMVSHIINRQLDPTGAPASLSKPIVTDLLRDRLHFNGLIITDDMDAAAISKHYSTKDAIEQAILAGDDIILYGGTLQHKPATDTKILFNTMLELAKNNPIIRKKIYQAYYRIQQFKTEDMLD